MLIEEESTVDNSDNTPVRPNDKIPLTYDRNENIKYFGGNDSTKKSGPECLVGNGYLQYNKCLQVIRWWWHFPAPINIQVCYILDKKPKS